MFRKTIATAVASLMALSLGSFGTLAETESKYKEAIGAMGALEIMVGDAGSNDFRAGDPIKRSEFAKVAIHALGLRDVAASFAKESAFPDVANDHWAVGYIGAAASQGIVIGDTAGNFRPDDPISYEEAVTVLVRMAGYEPDAQSKGGYPAGYLTIGQTGGVLDKVPVTPARPVDRGTVAQMTYNALNMPMMEQTGAGNSLNYEVVDKTLLEDRLHAREVRGILEASSHISLSGEGAGEGRLVIDGTAYEAEMDSSLLVGQSVRALVRNTDEGDTVFFLTADSARTKTLTLHAEDIESITAAEIIYDNGSDRVTEKLASGVRFLVNGQPASTVEVPKIGTVTLIANSARQYSVVSILSYENMLVESVYTSSDKVTSTKGETLTLDAEDSRLYFTLRDADGNDMTLADLAKNDVLSVAKSTDGRIMQIRVSRKTAAGTVDEIADDRITLSGETYTLSPGFDGKLKLGDRVTLRLDAMNCIAAADTLEAAGTNYAYLLNTEKANGIDGKLQFSVLDTEGTVQTLTGADKMRLDGQGGLTAEQVNTELDAFRGLVALSANEAGLVTEITRAADETASFPQSHENRFVLNTLLSEAVYNSASMKIGSVSIDENTVFFLIPDGETDTEKYTADNYTILTDKTAYNAYVYDMKEDMTAGVVILTNAQGSVSADAPLLVVSRISTVQNDAGETTDKLYGLSEGKSVELMAADGVTLSHLQEGDIVQYRTDSVGFITEVRSLLSAENRETESKTTLSDTVEIVYGKVTGRFSGSVNVSVDGKGAENYKTADATVYLYDSTRPASRVQTADMADITKHAEDGSRIFLHLCEGVAKEIVIVK